MGRDLQRKRDYMKDYRERNPEYNAGYKSENPEKVRARAAKRYEEKREEILANLKRQRDDLRVEMIAAYGGCCVCCGEDAPGFLTIDHVNGGGSAHRQSLGGAGNSVIKDLKKRGWPKGEYQLLCYNCNCGRERNGGVCPHND